MKLSIDFSVFTPESFGFVIGDFEFEAFPKVGDRVDLFDRIKPRPTIGGFSGIMTVETILDVDGSASILLDDIVVVGVEEASELERFLATKLGLIVDKSSTHAFEDS